MKTGKCIVLICCECGTHKVVSGKRGYYKCSKCHNDYVWTGGYVTTYEKLKERKEEKKRPTPEQAQLRYVLTGERA